MTGRLEDPGNTREYVARWHGIVEEHLASKLAGILRRLAEHEAAQVGPADLHAALARHVTHAFQIAATPGGGVHAAIDYLEQRVAASPSPGGT